MKLLLAWLGGFAFGYAICIGLPDPESPFMVGLVMAVLGAGALTVHDAGCLRTLLIFGGGPLLAIVFQLLMKPFKVLLPFAVVGAIQPAVAVVFTLLCMVVSIPGRLSLFVLLALASLGLGVAGYGMHLWTPQATLWQQLGGYGMTFGFTVLLSVGAAFLKRREGRRAEPKQAVSL